MRTTLIHRVRNARITRCNIVDPISIASNVERKFPGGSHADDRSIAITSPHIPAFKTRPFSPNIGLRSENAMRRITLYFLFFPISCTRRSVMLDIGMNSLCLAGYGREFSIRPQSRVGLIRQIKYPSTDLDDPVLEKSPFVERISLPSRHLPGTLRCSLSQARAEAAIWLCRICAPRVCELRR